MPNDQRLIWIQDSHERIVPRAPATAVRRISVCGARGQVVSFQVGIRPHRVVRTLGVSLRGALKVQATVRLAGLVPLKRQTMNTPDGMVEAEAPGYVPDPLFPVQFEALDARVSRALWVSVRLPRRNVT